MIVYAKTCGLPRCERPVLSVQSQALYCSREHTHKARDLRTQQRIREDPERRERERQRNQGRVRDREAYFENYYRRRRLVTRRRRANEKLARAKQGRPSGTPWYFGQCLRCGETFLAKAYGGCLPSYCSDQCQANTCKERRALRKRLAYIEPVYRRQVFERDDWECQLCGLHLQANDHTRHDYATIDHIIPLAAGGLHSMANVQAACGRCNSHKSDLVL